MFERKRAMAAGIIAAGCFFLPSCATDAWVDLRPIPECTGPVTISVSSGLTPTFTWTPDCTLGRLIVEQGPDEEYWGTEAHGTNIYRSPIVYGVPPPDAEDPHPPNPLSAGTTYRVTVYRWVSVRPESLTLLGFTDFTP